MITNGDDLFAGPLQQELGNLDFRWLLGVPAVHAGLAVSTPDDRAVRQLIGHDDVCLLA